MPISTVGGVPQKYSNRLVHGVLSAKFGGGLPIKLHEHKIHGVLSSDKSGNFQNIADNFGYISEIEG